MTIFTLKLEYIDKIIEVHINAFPNFFLTFLGPKFLKEFYNSFIEDDAGIGFVAIEDGKICGAVVGTLEPEGYFKRLLKRRWFAFCVASFDAVIKKPSIVPRLFRAFFYRGDSPDHGHSRSLLSSIAVAPSSQGKGVGSMLLTAWLDEVKKRGSLGCFLTTDKDNNDAVNNFYKNHGWELDSSYETSQGRKMNRYVYDF